MLWRRRFLVLAVAVLAVAIALPARAAARPGEILFTRGVDQGNTIRSVLTLVREDGSGLRELTSAGASESRAAWSPDGSHLAFTRATETSGEWRSDGLWVMRADGGGRRRVLTPDDGIPSSVDWSPDGRSLVYSVNDAVKGHIGVVGVDGKGRRVVTRAVLGEPSPQWSPDGRHIAFVVSGVVIVVGVDGADPTPVSPPGMAASNASWSRQGRLAFSAMPASNPMAGSKLWIAGTGRASGRQVGDVSTDGRPPRWSTDGHRLAFSRSAISVAAADGSDAYTAHHLGETFEGFDSSPSWSPDGRSIAFVQAFRTGTIRVVPASGGRARTIASAGAYPFSEVAWRPGVR